MTTRTLYIAEVTDPITGRLTMVEAASPDDLEQKLDALLAGDYPDRENQPVVELIQ